MRLLLDTHAFLWWLAGNTRLSMSARRAMEDPDNGVIVSAASAWEITTKHRIGKLSGAAAVAQDVPAPSRVRASRSCRSRSKTQNAPEGFLVRIATLSTACSLPEPWREGWCWCPSTGCSTNTVYGAFGDSPAEGRIASLPSCTAGTRTRTTSRSARSSGRPRPRKSEMAPCAPESRCTPPCTASPTRHPTPDVTGCCSRHRRGAVHQRGVHLSAQGRGRGPRLTACRAGSA